MGAHPVVDFGGEICGSLESATEREWLVTNGLGGYASGTIAGILTRRYHGLLIAALQPPGGRTLLVSKFDEVLSYDGRNYELGANRWSDDSISPRGFRLIERFRLEGTTPVWTFTCADALLEKRVWMQDGANTTYVRYEMLRGAAGAADIEIKALVNYRDFHHTTTAGNCEIQVTPVERGLRVDPHFGSQPQQGAHQNGGEGGVGGANGGDAANTFYLFCDSAQAEARSEWYRNFELSEENARGLDHQEDHFLAGIFRAHLVVGQSLTLVLSTDSQASSAANAVGRSSTRALARAVLAAQSASAKTASIAEAASNTKTTTGTKTTLPARTPAAARAAFEERLLEYWVAAQPQASMDAPSWIRQLVLAAAQFPVRRELKADSEDGAHTIVAGYPWFGEWSRDTMIALPGLTLETGRPDLARSILRNAAQFLDQGMLPNVFPERSGPGSLAQYNTVDATLWYFEALRQYYVATSDKALLEELYEKLSEVIDWHVRGTRYGIQVDDADGLLHAGEGDSQLTWMDARVNGQAMTPRIGKPVEVNALWYNALRSMSRFSFALDKPTAKYVSMAERVQKTFARFWNGDAGFCYDVVDGPSGNDASLRPNQILAVSLPESPLTEEQRRAVVDVCAQRLITPRGLRTLDSADPRYHGTYSGPPSQRDAAYHQGTVWAWLLGPFVLAHLRVYRNATLALSFLEPISRNLLAYGVGSVGEIFEGDAPFKSCGAIAQAWSVGEVLRAWHACHDAGLPARKLAIAK
jgi:glycogen debranching enzyme